MDLKCIACHTKKAKIFSEENRFPCFPSISLTKNSIVKPELKIEVLIFNRLMKAFYIFRVVVRSGGKDGYSFVHRH